MIGALLNKLILSLTINIKVKLLRYKDLETIDTAFYFYNLDKINIFKEIANYAESLRWYKNDYNIKVLFY